MSDAEKKKKGTSETLMNTLPAENLQEALQAF